ncbi:MAG: hypothetical protein ABIJ61_03320 [bacterium]
MAKKKAKKKKAKRRAPQRAKKGKKTKRLKKYKAPAVIKTDIALTKGQLRRAKKGSRGYEYSVTHTEDYSVDYDKSEVA